MILLPEWAGRETDCKNRPVHRGQLSIWSEKFTFSRSLHCKRSGFSQRARMLCNMDDFGSGQNELAAPGLKRRN